MASATENQDQERRAAFELHCAILDSEGATIVDRLHERSFVLNIFTANTAELVHALELFATPEVAIKLMAVENKAAGVQSHRDVVRLFHNFLAAAMTLVDQTRVFMRKHYERTPIATLYQAEIDRRFKSNELHAFMQGLRNFMIHRGLPPSTRRITFTKGGGFECGILLSREGLYDYKNWPPLALKFLPKQAEQINLLEVCKQYAEAVVEFHEWLDDTIKEHHGDALATLRRLQKEYEGKYGHLFKEPSQATIEEMTRRHPK